MHGKELICEGGKACFFRWKVQPDLACLANVFLKLSWQIGSCDDSSGQGQFGRGRLL